VVIVTAGKAAAEGLAGALLEAAGAGVSVLAVQPPKPRANRPPVRVKKKCLAFMLVITAGNF
jgi:hypothetical protein